METRNKIAVLRPRDFGWESKSANEYIAMIRDDKDRLNAALVGARFLWTNKHWKPIVEFLDREGMATVTDIEIAMRTITQSEVSQVLGYLRAMGFVEYFTHSKFYWYHLNKVRIEQYFNAIANYAKISG